MAIAAFSDGASGFEAGTVVCRGWPSAPLKYSTCWVRWACGAGVAPSAVAAAAVAATAAAAMPTDTAVRMDVRLRCCPEVFLRMGVPPEARRNAPG